MSDTFHITPRDLLAFEAYPLVRELADAGATLVAVRGRGEEGCSWSSGVYDVSPCPSASASGYVWHYCDPQEWCREFLEEHPGFQC
jgi:hypothetical protein